MKYNENEYISKKEFNELIDDFIIKNANLQASAIAHTVVDIAEFFRVTNIDLKMCLSKAPIDPINHILTVKMNNLTSGGVSIDVGVVALPLLSDEDAKDAVSHIGQAIEFAIKDIKASMGGKVKEVIHKKSDDFNKKTNSILN